VPIPETPARPIRIRVEKVEQGSDDDLCIAELQLYHRGMAVIPRPPPHVVYSPGDECGCGYAVHFVNLRGRHPHRDGPLAERDWGSYSFCDDGRRVALSAHAGGFAVLDLTSGRPLYHTRNSGHVTQLKWITNTNLQITKWADEHSTRFELDLINPEAGLSSVSD
jgi:YD repeat-containing protein